MPLIYYYYYYYYVSQLLHKLLQHFLIFRKKTWNHFHVRTKAPHDQQ
jgi:hypothetical protein